LEGVCIAGGEPTLNKDLPDFIKKIKKMGYLVKLDTNGSNPEMLKKLISEKLVDYFAMDVKAPLEPKYNDAAGVKIDLEKIKKSIEIIKNFGIEYEFRTTVVPVLHAKEDIIQIAKKLSPARRYFLQQFRPQKTLDSSFEKEKPYSSEELTEICRSIQPYFGYCGARVFA
jgi:pyruvate formate lyase activating enzyme